MRRFACELRDCAYWAALYLLDISFADILVLSYIHIHLAFDIFTWKLRGAP